MVLKTIVHLNRIPYKQGLNWTRMVLKNIVQLNRIPYKQGLFFFFWERSKDYVEHGFKKIVQLNRIPYK